MQYITTRSFASVRRQYEFGETIDPNSITAAEWLRGVESGAIVPARFYGTATEVAARGVPGPGIVVYETDTKQIKIGDGSTVPGSLPVAGEDTFLTKAGNLTGLADVAAARTALGLGEAATKSMAQVAADAALTGAYAQRANNLSDLASAATARSNLGLKTPATLQTLGRMVSGQYYSSIVTTSLSTSATLGNGTLRVLPWFVPNDVTISRIGAEVVTIGEAGSKYRLGIYADNGSCYPGALVLDAGTINGDSATTQEITVSYALTAGLYWIGGVVQAAPTTQPTMRVVSAWTPPFSTAMGTSAPASANTVVGYSHGSVTDSLPANYTATIGPIGNVARVFVKVA